MLKKYPWIYIPTLYFQEGLPYAIVMSMSAVFFKSMGASNVFIGLTTAISLPWTLKFLWAPYVDIYATKKKWILKAEFLLALLLLITAFIIFRLQSYYLVVGVLVLIAIASATHDIAIDGYYLDVLDRDNQSYFVGVRNAAYRIANIFCSGAMVYLAGAVAQTQGLTFGWFVAYLVLAACIFAGFFFHKFYLPEPTIQTIPFDLTKKTNESDNSKIIKRVNSSSFREIILSYFQQPGALAITLYILLFRLGDALMLKQAPNFLLDPPAKAGMGISVQEFGILYGMVGVIFLLLGGLAGGLIVGKFGLKKTLWPCALMQNSAILLYYYLSVCHPALSMVYICNAVEQLAWGLGNAVYTVFLLNTVKSEFKASHYAVATALMSLGIIIPGTFSGFIYEKLGYKQFFMVSFLATIPGLVTIMFLPAKNLQKNFNNRID